MQSYCNLPWEKMHRYLLETGKERRAEALCHKAFHNIENIISFDTGMLFILGANLKPIKKQILGIEPRVTEEYLTYYSKLQNGRFSYLVENVDVDWDNIEDCEFKRDYINPQRIKHSMAGFFYHSPKRLGATFVINRIGKSKFTPTERRTFHLSCSHLSNLYANLCISPDDNQNSFFLQELTQPLTKRETEIVQLLCQGMSPKRIGQIKFISMKTVYNHMASIFKKADVNCQRDLIVKFLKSS